MAYKGRRDPEVGIVIKQSLCEVYRGADHTKWIEIFIPRSDGTPYEWGTIMVKPEQVDYIDNVYNLVRVNDKAEIVNSTKEKDTRSILDSEKMTPDVIIGHVLRKDLGITGKTAKEVYDDYIQSGLTMYNYILRHHPAGSAQNAANSQRIPATPDEL